MEIVGRHLRDEALSRSISSEKDLFARSSFNRFYYAAFLRVTRGLAIMSPEWGGLPHSDIPPLLRGKVTSALKKLHSQAKRNDDSDLVSKISFALRAAGELANLLDQGRMTRVAADYRPDQFVDFSSFEDFSLNMVTVTMASSWGHKANAHMQKLERAWREVIV